MLYTSSQLFYMFNDYMKSLDYKHEPTELYTPIEYTISLGGKRIRPIFMLMAYNLFKDDVSTILSQAAGIEIYHNYTLLHDDLMDKSEKRRNKPTVYKKWDENTAILSGDAMLVLAYEFMCRNAFDKLSGILDVFNKTALEICEGQQWDMQFETYSNVDEKEYIEMIRLKTSVLLGASLKIGALMAGADEQDASLLYDLGEKIGIAFQLQDDYLDVYGDTITFGKNIGGDIVNNKKTFMLISAQNLADEAQKRDLDRWIESKEFVPSEKIKAVTNIYNELGIDNLCNKKIEAYFNEGFIILDELKIKDERKEMLKSYLNTLINRNV